MTQLYVSMLRRIATAAGIAGAMAAAHAVSHRAPSTGMELLREMHETYRGRWYTTLRFTQKTTTRNTNGTDVISTWYESVRFTETTGSQLRIDTGDPAQGNGVLYTADSLWVVRAGKQVAARAGGNTILPLIHSVYLQAAERTAAELRSTGVDLARTLVVREWQGKRAWVVGANSASDTTSPQFWVDQATHAVVRAIFSPVSGAPVMDMHFDKLVSLNGGWLATECTFYVGGKLEQREEYSDWKANIEFSPALFNTGTWSSAPHWAIAATPRPTNP